MKFLGYMDAPLTTPDPDHVDAPLLTRTAPGADAALLTRESKDAPALARSSSPQAEMYSTAGRLFRLYHCGVCGHVEFMLED